MAWGNYSTALQMREIVRNIIKDEIERVRPRYQLATVQSFDRVNRKCTIRYNGETSDVVVNMGSVQPASIGQIVRIDGLLGDRYVAEVLGPAFEPLESRVYDLETATDLTVPSLDGTVGLLGTGGIQYDMLRRMGGTNFKWEGVRTVTSTGISWSHRGILVGAGKDTLVFPGGYLSLVMPANTTSIPVNSGALTAVTVADGSIPLGAWRTLYYNPSWTENTDSVDSRWNIVAYTGSNFTVPQHWILVAGRISTGQVVWGDGREQDWWRTPTFSNSWGHYGGDYDDVAYGLFDGVVRLEGLAGGGTFGTTAVMFNLPANYRPSGTKIYAPSAGIGAVGRLDITSAGDVIAYAQGTASWMSLEGISFIPKQ